MSDLLEKNVTDLLDRVQKLETKEAGLEVFKQTLDGLDKVTAYSVTTLNSLVELLISNKTVKTEDLEQAIAKEQERLNTALSARNDGNKPKDNTVDDKKE